MLKIENVEVVGWEHAIRGMRNPKNSWDRSDSARCGRRICEEGCPYMDTPECQDADPDTMIIGPNDHKLMMSLAKGGPVHAKYRRYITVYLDITAPFYWWKEFKTYRHGRKFMDDDRLFELDDYEIDNIEYHIETNSCSTMHKIHDKEFTLDDFSTEHLLPNPSMEVLTSVVGALNVARNCYLACQDPVIKKDWWWQMIQLLPSSYNQKRTVRLDYEVLAAIYEFRKDHKLDEWHVFCDWIKSLPYSEIITGENV